MEQFGRYLLLERLAAGGVAEVFRAAVTGSAGFQRQVAIKRVLPHLVTEPETVRMLVEEAKMASGLSHPNIVQVLDLGDRDGLPFIAMEMVAGQPLGSLVVAAHKAGVRLPPEMCFALMADALEGLGYAHQKRDGMGRPMGIIHRDVSPQNIMVTYEGRVMLLDFGIAKAHQRTSTTAVGRLKGKPGYLSPEVVKGEPVTQELDLYAAGVVLHELVAMRRMRPTGNDLELLNVVASGFVPGFDELGVEIPPQAADVVYQALAPLPAERFPDAATFKANLVGVAAELGWAWTQGHTADVMRQLFREEIAREEEAQARFQVMVDEWLADPSHRSELPPPAPPPAGPPPEPSPAPATGLPLRGASAFADPPPTLLIQDGRRLGRSGRRRQALLGAAAGATAVALLGVAAWWLAPRDTATTTAEVPPPADGPPEGPAGAPAHVAVGSIPAGATLLVNGEEMGVTPMDVEIPPGPPVKVRVELPGYATVEQVVSAERAPVSIQVALVKAAGEHDAQPYARRPRPRPRPVAAGNGALTLGSTPWARVLIDGKDTRKFTPLVGHALPSGRHTVTLVNDELKLKATFPVDIRPGETTTINRALK